MGDESKIFQLLKQINSEITTIKIQNQDIVNQIKEVKQELKHFKTEFETELNKLKTESEHFKQENKQLKDRLDKIERKSKKYNIIIYGISERQSEDIIEEVFGLFQTRFSLNLNKGEIRDTYRIGQYDENKTRPICIEFTSYDLKKVILQKSSCLKGSGIAVSSDYIQEDYLKKKYLISQLKIERSHGRSAQIKGQSLIIDDIQYFYEDLKAQKHKVNERVAAVPGEEAEENRLSEREECVQEENPKKLKNLRSNSRKQ